MTDALRAIVAGLEVARADELAAVVDLPPAQLPCEFWTARPTLGVIRDAARSRLVAPDAVFGAVLVRVAAITPHTVELPATVGSPVGLTTFVALVGGPETGKSAAAGVAAELVPAPPEVLDRLPIGSGEGMTEILFDVVDDEDDQGKRIKVKRQVRHAAIFHIDEGAALSDLGARSGSTLLATLRSAWSHATIGNTNASAERRRILDGRSYVYGVTMGIQPDMAGPLLADTAAGTPQRFLWLLATDPHRGDQQPGWPGELDWQPPSATDLDDYIVSRGGWRRNQLHLDDTIVDDVRADRVDALRGDTIRSQADAHVTLSRLKVAALLALLDERLHVTVDDWQLAGVVVATSRRVRGQVQATVDLILERKEFAGIERHARREIHVEESKEQRALVSASRSVGNVAVRHASRDHHAEQGGGCTRACFTAAVGSKYRAVVTVDDAIGEAERQAWIVPVGDRWQPGESRPS